MKKKHPKPEEKWDQSRVEQFWDWVTSSRHRYDGWRQRRGALAPSVERLEKRIREAFRKVTVGSNVMLYLSGAAEDDYLPESFQKVLRRQEERVQWGVIPLDMLYACDDCLFYLDAEGTRFLLPAYMCYDLCYPDEGWNGLSDFLSSPEGRLGLFNEFQRACVTDYVNEKRLQGMRNGWDAHNLGGWNFLLPWEEQTRLSTRADGSPSFFAEEQLVRYCEREGVSLA